MMDRDDDDRVWPTVLPSDLERLMRLAGRRRGTPPVHREADQPIPLARTWDQPDDYVCLPEQAMRRLERERALLLRFAQADQQVIAAVDGSENTDGWTPQEHDAFCDKLDALVAERDAAHAALIDAGLLEREDDDEEGAEA